MWALLQGEGTQTSIRIIHRKPFNPDVSAITACDDLLLVHGPVLPEGSGLVQLPK